MEVYEKSLVTFLEHVDEQKNILECHCKQIHLALRKLESRKLREELKWNEERLRKEEGLEVKTHVDFSEVDELIKKAQSVLTFDDLQKADKKGKKEKTFSRTTAATKKTAKVSTASIPSQQSSSVYNRARPKSSGITSKTKTSSTVRGRIRNGETTATATTTTAAASASTKTTLKTTVLKYNRKGVSSTHSMVGTTARTKATQLPHSISTTTSTDRDSASARKSSSGTGARTTSRGVNCSSATSATSRNKEVSEKQNVESKVRNLPKEIKTSLINNEPPNNNVPNTTPINPPKDELPTPPFTPEFIRVYTHSCKQAKHLRIAESKICTENKAVMKTYLEILKRDVTDEPNKEGCTKGVGDFDALCKYLTQCEIERRDLENIIKETTEIRNEADAVLETFSGFHGYLRDEKSASKIIHYPGKFKDALNDHFTSSKLKFRGRCMERLARLLKDLASAKDKKILSNSNAICKYRLLYALLNDSMTSPVVVIDHDEDEDDDKS